MRRARLISLLSPELAAALALLACGSRTGLLEMGTEPTDARADAIADASDLTDASGAADTTATDADAMFSPFCPPPATIPANGPCSMAATLVCPWVSRDPACSGNPSRGECICSQGIWSCKSLSPCATCPSPNEVSAGTPCIGYLVGLSCPGHPIVCGHATFYDVLRCDGTAWVTVVPTICAIDGGA
ncbi:MAG TPA: hypothetical protein VGY54_22750 [Polyangiaceae bacterium]|nr:hypothetical protein [Polyangiaceae bacterium]